MSDNQNKYLQEQINYLKSSKNLQACGVTLAYTTAALMLIAAGMLLQTQDKDLLPTALLQGTLGTFSCYWGDKMRKRYKATKNALNELKKEQNQK